MKRYLLITALGGTMAVGACAQDVKSIIDDLNRPQPESLQSAGADAPIVLQSQSESVEIMPEVVELDAPMSEPVPEAEMVVATEVSVEPEVVELDAPVGAAEVSDEIVIAEVSTNDALVDGVEMTVSNEESVVEVQPAAVETKEADAAVAQTDEVEIIAETDSTEAEISGGKVSLNLKEVALQDVIRLFGRLSNANIIIPDMGEEIATRKVDVNLSGVEWKPSLQAILDTHGLELYEKIPGSNVYSIREKPADAPDPLEVKTFRLKYATVEAVNSLISGLVPSSGKVALFPSRNMIVVQSTANSLAEVENIINLVDLPREQVFIEAKFLELSDSASEQLGIDWQMLGGSDGGYRINASGLSSSYSDSEIDTRTTTTIFGTDSAPTLFDTLNGDSGLYQDVSGPNFNQTIEATATKALLSADDFGVVLAALKEINGAKIVSNPKIIVANEETASIHIGSKKPNVKGTTQTAGDNQAITTYALDDTEPYFEDGIRVEVTPTINTSSNITVQIQPTLDRLDANPFTAPDGTEFYGKSTKTINTMFNLQSGQTAAIGGLTEASDADVDRKIPVLGSIPVLGRLFSYTTKTKEQAETIIFVTVGLANPDIINFDTGLPEDANLTRRYRLMSGADKSIDAEKLKLLETQEAERQAAEIRALQAAEAKRLEKQKK